MVVNEIFSTFARELNYKTIKFFFNSNMSEYRKKYEKPSMQVFDLKQQPKLLVGSTDASLNDYNWNDYREE